jgi:hypothetical protein
MEHQQGSAFLSAALYRHRAEVYLSILCHDVEYNCLVAAYLWFVSCYNRHIGHPLRINLSSDGTKFNIPANVSHGVIVLRLLIRWPFA